MVKDEDILISPQRKAEQLLYMADAVQRSIKSRRNIVSDMKKDNDAIVDDFEASMTFDTSEATLLSTATGSTASLTQEDSGEKRPKPPSKGKSEKKSKTKTIADLRQQLHDCKSALVEIKENANLKYLKLKMEHDELDEAYAKLKELKNKVDEENGVLKRKLSSAVGSDRVEWVAKLEDSQAKLQAELDTLKTERDEAKRQTEEFKSMCCTSCRDKMNPASQVQNKPAPRSRSLWSLFQLDEEAKATTEAAASTVATICGSNNGTVPTSEVQSIRMHAGSETGVQSSNEEEEPGMNHSDDEEPVNMMEGDDAPFRTSANDDLEADLEAIEQKMKDDIENMSREWKRPTKKRVHNHTVRRDAKLRSSSNNKRSALGKSKSSARGSLDSFFSQSIRKLGAEEMDEEKSFYSLQQKSVASSSSKDAGGTKQQSERKDSAQDDTADGTSGSHGSQVGTLGEPTEVISSTPEDAKSSVPTPVSSPGGGRHSLMAKGFSIRDSFRNLSEEIEDESTTSSSSSKAFDRRLENLRAKSLRADLMQEKGRKKAPQKSTLRSSRSVCDRKAVHWEDPSKKDDEAKLKVRKDVEQWAAVDMAPICSLTI